LEEAFYVLEGEFSFQYNEMVINATTGSFMNIQKGVVHTYKKTSKSTGRLLVTVIPAGFENFFEELGVPVTDDKSFTPRTDPLDIARLVDVSTKHGVIYVPELKKENY
jgi:hypothetical protein